MGILVPLFALSIPIVAIIGSYYYKVQKMKLERQALGGGDLRLLEELKQENASLRKRVENLEMVTSDPDISQLEGASTQELQHQIDYLANEIKQLKVSN
ncbi:hypothetical protein R9C00_14950 [Flammeovirgaceae bacterium SG7u.111]|nr:hypothetical protein [Flammeovirgaceae bacterium SG7u.132]WPO32999.1 hypothetical protein R9C00_14950 [Flammeovirgaceae bacterium SG7u.111]